MGKNARQIAMEILVRMQRDAAYSNLTLDAALRRNELPARDAALVSALVYGVEERLYTIDICRGAMPFDTACRTC